jgi:hypothetical protein
VPPLPIHLRRARGVVVTEAELGGEKQASSTETEVAGRFAGSCRSRSRSLVAQGAAAAKFELEAARGGGELQRAAEMGTSDGDGGG